MLFEVIKACNYMDVQPLLDLACAKVATLIKGKTVRLLSAKHPRSLHARCGPARTGMGAFFTPLLRPSSPPPVPPFLLQAQQIRDVFSVKLDFTPEEQEQLKAEK